MTTRKSWTIRCLAWSVPILLAVGIVWGWTHRVIVVKNYTSQIKTVGLALKLYADDHQGTLPPSLENLLPIYFTEHNVLDGVQYVAPGAKLAELPPHTVIARRPYPEDHRVGEVHADLSAESHRL